MSLEFPHLGKHCELPGCNVLDFLPFKCNKCYHFYCLEHRTLEGHKCSSVSLVDCPLCSVKLDVTGKDPNEIVNAHISRGCIVTNPKPSVPKNTTVPVQSCAKCRKKELLANFCTGCNRHYCTKHRFTDTHGCGSIAAH